MDVSNSLINIAVVIDERESRVKGWAKRFIYKLKNNLKTIFPEFNWSVKLIPRYDFPVNIPKDPLELLEFGSDIKVEYNLDFVIVLTTMPLKSRFEQSPNAVPSDMLETAVISLAKILETYKDKDAEEAMLILAKHVLGHLWDLNHNDNSVMKHRKFWSKEEENNDWSAEEKRKIKQYLKNIADPRLEELKNAKRNKLLFYLQVIYREKWTLIQDIFLFRTLFMMFHLGRFTAATVVSMLFLLLTAEAWELGAAISPRLANIEVLAVIIIATVSIYLGQNFQKLARSDKLMEQTVRSRVVLFGTLLVGIMAYWISIFIVCSGIIYILPHRTLCQWAGIKDNTLPIIHFAKLMASVGVLASAVGGNLEEEDNIKAVIVYTEEA